MVGGDGQLISFARDRRAGALMFALFVLILPVLFASAPQIFDDGDTSWHLAVGEWILQHRSVPSIDHFSFTAAGRRWVAMEWAADILFALAFRMAGYAGVCALVAAALMALHGILFCYLERRVSPVALSATLIALDLVLAPFILARPHVLVWPILAGWTVLLLRAAESGRAPPVWGALIMLAWTNLHGSFPLGAVIGVAVAVDALVATQWKTLPQWTEFALVSVLATLLNANGAAGLLQPLKIAGLSSLGLIQEWQASSPSFTPQFYLVILAGLGALLWNGVRVPVGRLVLLLLMLAMAFTQMRHQSWFVIVAAAVLPPLFMQSKLATSRRFAFGAAAIPVLALRAIVPVIPAENSANPRHLMEAIPSELRTEPVFNEYTFGGPLILEGVRPFIDGRSELYGDEFVSEYSAISKGDLAKFERVVDRFKIRWTILSASNSSLIQALDSSAEWKRVYSDKIGVIHVRRS